jgi:hypothetical protein
MWDLMRAAVLAGLLLGAAAAPAAAIADARASRPPVAEPSTRRTDWPLLTVAVVALVIGRVVVDRRRKPRRSPQPLTGLPPAESPGPC